MAQYTFNDVKLAGCSVVLGENLHCIEDEPQYWNDDPFRLARLKDLLGMDSRYVASPQTTTSDLCLQAATSLMQALAISPSEVSAVISITQTPDYRAPGNAYVLHNALGLGRDCVALDVCQGCAGFVYGLWLAGMMASTGGGGVLLCAGDTLSRLAHSRDYTTAPLFGDAGSAAWVKFCPGAGPMHFLLQSNGRELQKLYVPAGGARQPSSELTAREITSEDGSVRSLDSLHMDGAGVFSFAMSEQPALLRQMLEYAKMQPEEIDYLVLHQANRYIVQTIAKKAGFPASKVPSQAFGRYGNQNAASIPGVLCDELALQLAQRKAEVVLQGFGIGLSWGACQLRLENMLCIPPQVYGGKPCPQQTPQQSPQQSPL